MGTPPDQQRLRDLAGTIKDKLYSKHLGGRITEGGELDDAIHAMVAFLGESGYVVSKPVIRTDRLDLFAIRDEVIRRIGDQISRKEVPHPGSVLDGLIDDPKEWRAFEKTLIADGWMAYANEIGSQYRLPPAAEARYREITMTRPQRLLRWLGPKTGAVVFMAIGIVLGLVIQDAYRLIFPGR